MCHTESGIALSVKILDRTLTFYCTTFCIAQQLANLGAYFIDNLISVPCDHLTLSSTCTCMHLGSHHELKIYTDGS